VIGDTEKSAVEAQDFQRAPASHFDHVELGQKDHVVFLKGAGHGIDQQLARSFLYPDYSFAGVVPEIANRGTQRLFAGLFECFDLEIFIGFSLINHLAKLIYFARHYLRQGLLCKTVLSCRSA
jgi:hypothetical protein